MKTRDYLKITTSYFKNHRLKTLLLFSSLILIFFIANILVQTGTNFSNILTDYLENYSEGRTLSVYKSGPYSQIIEELSSYDHIVLAYNQQLNTSAAKINLNNQLSDISLKPLSTKYSPKIIDGRKVTKTGEIICPRYIAKENKDLKTKEDVIDMSKFLNQELNLTYEKTIYLDLYAINVEKEYLKTFTLVGLYDDGYSMGMYSDCYVLESDVRKIVEEKQPTYTDEYLSKVVVHSDTLSSFVVVDNIKNIETVISKLKENGYKAERIVQFKTDVIDYINNTSNILLTIMLILIIILAIIYLNNLIKSQKNEIALYKTFGYSNKEISKIITTEIIFIYTISIIIELILLILTIYITNIKIDQILDYAYINLRINAIPQLLFTTFLIALIAFISKLSIAKIYKLEVGNIFRANSL